MVSACEGGEVCVTCERRPGQPPVVAGVALLREGLGDWALLPEDLNMLLAGDDLALLRADAEATG
jgi:hypothetical protein